MRIRRVSRLGPTKAGHATALAGSVLVALYLVGAGGTGLLLAGGLLLGLPLACTLYLFIAASELGRRVAVLRYTAAGPVEAYASPVAVRVESRSRWLAGFVEVEDEPPSGVPVLTSPRGRGGLGPGGAFEHVYLVAPRVGKWGFGPLRLAFTGPLLLARAVLLVEPDGESSIAGAPSRGLAAGAARIRDIEDPYSTPTRRLVRREGTEIYAIREWVEGDELRLIDWKATARLGKLYVKELRRETTIPVVFLFAPGPGALEGPEYGTPFEELARAIYVLGEDVLAREGSVGYLALSGGERIAEPPSRGVEGLARLVQAISMTPPPRGVPPARVLEELVEYLRRHAPGRVAVVAVAESERIPALARELDPLAERGVRIYYLTLREGELVFHSHAVQGVEEGASQPR